MVGISTATAQEQWRCTDTSGVGSNPRLVSKHPVTEVDPQKQIQSPKMYGCMLRHRSYVGWQLPKVLSECKMLPEVNWSKRDVVAARRLVSANKSTSHCHRDKSFLLLIFIQFQLTIKYVRGRR